MLQIDGSQYSGSGTIVRQAVMFSALTGKPVHLVNARAKRPKPGLRAQHLQVVEAVAELVQAKTEGLSLGAREFFFHPSRLKTGRRYVWDIGSAGSTTMLALGVLPVLAFAGAPVTVELHGGLFQDFAPSLFHLQKVVLPLLRRMGLEAEAQMARPGYVPKGEGILRLTVIPVRAPLSNLVLEEAGPVERVWGIALSSHLEERKVSHRMAEAATRVLAGAGFRAEIEEQNDTESLQPGAALALFADLSGGVRLGADQAGALRRPAEAIGKHVATQILEELKSGATLDRFAADQLIPFAALASGESRFIVPAETEHVTTNLWLAKTFLGAEAKLEDHTLSIKGVAFRPKFD